MSDLPVWPQIPEIYLATIMNIMALQVFSVLSVCDSHLIINCVCLVAFLVYTHLYCAIHLGLTIETECSFFFVFIALQSLFILHKQRTINLEHIRKF